jgi:glycosyltransferase involved in cell wall biosynthesis
LRKTFGIVGPQPPPRHGVSNVNEAIARHEASLGVRVAIFNTAPSSLRRSPAVRLGRLFRVARAGALAWMFAMRNRGATLYFSLSGGWGLIYEASMAAGARLLGARVIVHHHSFRYLDDAFWPLSVLARAAGPRAVHIVLGERMGELLKQRCPGVGEIVVLSNAVFVPSVSAGAPRALGTVGYLANLSWEKGLQQVIDTAELCNARGLPLQFVVAGPFEDPGVEAAFRRSSAGVPNLRHIGPVYGAEKARFFGEIDLLIFPTLYQHEAEPLVVLEALSHGRPVIAYARGCIPAMLGSGGGRAVPVAVPFAGAAADWIAGWTADRAAFQEESRLALVRFTSLRRESALALDRLSSRL